MCCTYSLQLFKNLVKKRWVAAEDSDDQSVIADADKELIKTYLVELMCSAPMDVQKQLAEAVGFLSYLFSLSPLSFLPCNE